MTGNQFWTGAGRMAAVTLILVVALMLAPVAGAASKYKVLYKFTGGADGDQAWGSVVFDAAGNLYGTTEWGGAYGAGVVFRLTPNLDGSWSESVLYSFTGGTDGGNPDHQSLIFDGEGNIYGTTALGGNLNNQQCYLAGWGPGCGVVFKLAPNANGSWTYSVLYRFTGGEDGGVPLTGLTFDTAGNLYGKTVYGGKSCPGYPGCGVVYRLTPNSDGSWTQNVIHSFRGHRDGTFPDAGSLIFDRNGNIYGTTTSGGGKGCSEQQGCGVVFELMPNPDGSWTEKVLHRFADGKDGGWIEGNLVFDADGNIYGTTFYFGAYGYGTVYKLSPKPDGSWSYRVLHQFKGGKDGANSYAGLVFDAAGNLYGTTTNGGAYGYGTVFRLTPKPDGKWTERVLHTFAARPAAYPCDKLIVDGAGNLFGTTTHNNWHGYAGASVVFEITP